MRIILSNSHKNTFQCGILFHIISQFSEKFNIWSGKEVADDRLASLRGEGRRVLDKMKNFYIIRTETFRYVVNSMEMSEKKTAELFKAFCDENRIKILKLLQTGEKCACRLNEEISVTQPTMSHHMKVLCDAGIVTGRKEGKWMHYSISPEGAQKALEVLSELTRTRTAEEDPLC